MQPYDSHSGYAAVQHTALQVTVHWIPVGQEDHCTNRGTQCRIQIQVRVKKLYWIFEMKHFFLGTTCIHPVGVCFYRNAGSKGIMSQKIFLEDINRMVNFCNILLCTMRFVRA